MCTHEETAHFTCALVLILFFFIIAVVVFLNIEEKVFGFWELHLLSSV